MKKKRKYRPFVCGDHTYNVRYDYYENDLNDPTVLLDGIDDRPINPYYNKDRLNDDLYWGKYSQGGSNYMFTPVVGDNDMGLEIRTSSKVDKRIHYFKRRIK